MCKFPACQYPANRDGYCIHHAKHFAGIKSKGRAVDRDYMKIVKDIKSARPYCELKTPVCTGRTQGLHHIQKRNRSNLKEFSNLLASCNRCNLWVEEHPKEAIKLGISKSKFKQ